MPNMWCLADDTVDLQCKASVVADMLLCYYFSIDRPLGEQGQATFI